MLLAADFVALAKVRAFLHMFRTNSFRGGLAVQSATVRGLSPLRPGANRALEGLPRGLPSPSCLMAFMRVLLSLAMPAMRERP